jgi:putative tricarboxylic transport membrane protein
MTDRIIGLGFVVLGVFILVLSLQLPQPLAATRIAYGPGFFPSILGAVIACSGVVMLVFKPDAELDEDEVAEPVHLRQCLRPMLVVCAALAYILFSQQLGFLILAPLILTALLMMGRVSVRQSLLIGVTGSIAVYVLFAKLLLVPLPLGLLTPFGAYL